MEDEMIINIENDDNSEIIVDADAALTLKDYEDLYNKPQINEVELDGNKSLEDLGIQKSGEYANTKVTNAEIDNLFLGGNSNG